MATRLHRACLPNLFLRCALHVYKNGSAGTSSTPEVSSVSLAKPANNHLGISASLLVSEFGPWLRGSLF